MMESISAYFSSHPTAFTWLTVFVVVMILYFLLKKFIKLTLIIVVVLLLVGGVQLFKDPATAPDKIRTSLETLKSGGEKIVEKFSNFWRDSKELADKASKVPGDINKLLDTTKEDVGK